MSNAVFDAKLSEFQKWATGVSPQFGDQVASIISNSYLSQMGETPVTPPVGSPATNTVEKIGALFDSLGSTYLKSVEAYYTTKGKIADLKLAAKGSAVTQVANAAGTVTGAVSPNILLIGGAALVGLLLLSRR